MSDTMKRMWTDRQVRSMADDSAKIRIEAGLTENAKPIYVHPIYMNFTTNEGERNYILTSLVFNNDPEPFATFGDYFDYIEDLCLEENAVILVSGGMGNTNPSRDLIATCIKKIDATSIGLFGILTTTHTPDNFTLAKAAITVVEFSDGVNKIN